MRKQLIFVLFATLIMSILSSCASASFVLTGNEYPALSKDAQVKVVLENKEIENFEEIGVIELVCSNPPPPLDKIVEQKQKLKQERKEQIALS